MIFVRSRSLGHKDGRSVIDDILEGMHRNRY
jgi:hypothetical protein